MRILRALPRPPGLRYLLFHNITQIPRAQHLLLIRAPLTQKPGNPLLRTLLFYDFQPCLLSLFAAVEAELGEGAISGELGRVQLLFAEAAILHQLVFS